VDNQPVAFQTLLVGFTPHKESGYALLLSLDQAVVDTGKMTPMRKTGEILLAGMVKLASADIVQPNPEIMAENAGQIYQKWLKSQAGKKSASPTVIKTARPEIMPDLNGLSLRKAMRNLQQLDLNVRITGSGRVVAQEPKPGRISGSEECLLTLRAEI
jgi:cell division protein FtsI (penicillin-binding protein 3)